MNQIFISLMAAAMLIATPAFASGDAHAPKQVEWSFDGVFGKMDKPSVQRGLQIYKEVCSACHSLKRVAFRSLTEIGLSEAEARSFAAGYQIHDGPNDMGEMFDRPGALSDKFPGPYANDKAGRAANNGALPPDLSLIIKAREDGANYVYSILTGYGETPPEGFVVPEGKHYNPYMSGHVIAMAQPLKDDSVSYQNADTKATLDQEAKDIVNFLQWAAEPEMETRKRMGIHVILFLSIMTCFFYVVKKRVWSNLH